MARRRNNQKKQPMKKYVSKIVRSVINKNTELKYYDVNTATGGFLFNGTQNDTPACFDIVNLAAVLPDVGINVNQRIGNEIKIWSVHLRMTMDINVEADPSFNKLRMSIIHPYVQNITTTDLAGSYLSNDTIYAQKNQQVGNFLHDRVYTVSLNGNETYTRQIKLKFRRGMRAEFDTFSSNTKGRLMLGLISDSPDNPPQVFITCRVFYTDA